MNGRKKDKSPSQDLPLKDLNLVVGMAWSEWSECNRCEKIGRRRRVGVCMVRVSVCVILLLKTLTSDQSSIFIWFCQLNNFFNLKGFTIYLVYTLLISEHLLHFLPEKRDLCFFELNLDRNELYFLKSAFSLLYRISTIDCIFELQIMLF